MARHKNIEWNLSAIQDMEVAKLALLMDIRDELQKLNRVFECHNFIRIPHVLDKIEANTRKKKPKAKP